MLELDVQPHPELLEVVSKARPPAVCKSDPCRPGDGCHAKVRATANQALTAGERLGKMNGIVSLNRLQAHGKWEMSA